MKKLLTIHAFPLWPLLKNVFVVSFIVFTVTSVIFGLFWMGLMKEFLSVAGDATMNEPFYMLQKIGGLAVMLLAVLYGIIGSVFTTVMVGVGGIIYNWMNGRGGGIEIEVSGLSTQSQGEYLAHLPSETVVGESNAGTGSGEQEQGDQTTHGGGTTSDL